MEAITYLLTVKKLEKQVNGLIAEVERLKSVAEKIVASSDGTPRGGGASDPVGNAAAAIADTKNRLDQLLSVYYETRYDVYQHIYMLPLPECEVLDLRYLKGLSWGEIEKKLNYSNAQVWRFKKSGIKKLQKILDSEKDEAK